MPNILITSAGGAGFIDLAQSLIVDHKVFFVDADAAFSEENPKLICSVIPLATDPEFAGALSALIQKWEIDYVVPGHDHELIPCAVLREKDGVKCVLPSIEFVKTCIDKKRLMQTLADYNISHLVPFESEDSVTYPAFAKPIRGSGSRQAHRIDSRDQLDGYLSLYGTPFSDALVHSYAGGQEYTVSVIVNNKNSIVGIVPKRVLIKRGLTLSAVSEKNDIITSVCEEIVEKMQPCGPFNVQLKLHDGICSIFEINPRLSSTALLTEKAFGSEIALYIDYFNSDHIDELPAMKEGVSFRRSYMQITS